MCDQLVPSTGVRDNRVRRCLCSLNLRGWICVSEAMRLLEQMRLEQAETGVSHGTMFPLFPKQRPWYFGRACDKKLLSEVFRVALEYVFEIDLVVSTEHGLKFFDPVSGTAFEVTDKWYDYWFLIVGQDETGSVFSEDETVVDASDSWLDMASPWTDVELQV